jgi:hypothetical protein
MIGKTITHYQTVSKIGDSGAPSITGFFSRGSPPLCRWPGEGFDARMAGEGTIKSVPPTLIYIKGNPTFDFLIPDPRYQSLLQRIGFPETEKENPHG